MSLNLLFRHGLPNARVTCGDDKSSVNEAVTLQGPYALPDCVAGQSSLEIMTLTKLGKADRDMATRAVQMVAFIECQHVFGLVHSVQLSCTGIVFMILVFSRNTDTDPLNFCDQTASVMGHLS